MISSSLNTLVVQGTVREGRSSIHSARYVTDRFHERGYDDEGGTLLDETYENRFEEFIEAVVEHTERFVPSTVESTPEAGL